MGVTSTGEERYTHLRCPKCGSKEVVHVLIVEQHRIVKQAQVTEGGHVYVTMYAPTNTDTYEETVEEVEFFCGDCDYPYANVDRFVRPINTRVREWVPELEVENV